MSVRSIFLVAAITCIATLSAVAHGQSEAGGAAASQASGATTLKYALWDANQIPQYKACATAFEKQNPGITIKLQQTGWSAYWNNLQTGMVANSVPSVFTDNWSDAAVFAANNQIVDVQPYATKQNVALNIYAPGLVKMWRLGQQGKLYALPKDWDAEAIFYNENYVKKAGITAKEMNHLTWNPQNGGTFEKVMAQLTLDKNGNNGLSSSFDKNAVSQYGFLAFYPGDNGDGQTTWSSFAHSAGWNYTKSGNPFGTHFDYTSPAFVNTISWYASLAHKGFAPKYADVPTSGPETIFASGKAAMMVDGSWMLKWVAAHADFPVGIAYLPTGPTGKRTTMVNDLGDTIWTGSKHKAAAWKWVKYMGSPACQNVVGTYGVVYPAIPSGDKAAVQMQQQKFHLNTQVFFNEANTAGGTFNGYVNSKAAKVTHITQVALEAVYTGQESARAAMSAANAQINALFQQ